MTSDDGRVSDSNRFVDSNRLVDGGRDFVCTIVGKILRELSRKMMLMKKKE
jgi:hypothetical protein